MNGSPDVFFCGLRGVVKQLAQPCRFVRVVSIGVPGEPAPDALAPWAVADAGRRFLRLEFDDISLDGMKELHAKDRAQFDRLTFCDRAMVAAMLAFARASDGPLLVHCGAGASRSPACALLVNALRLGPGREREAATLTDVRPCYPNTLVVKLGDDLLEREGALCAAWEETWVPPAPQDWNLPVEDDVR